MGGFEPTPRPWLQSAQHRGGIPENFEFQLLPDNWDAFQVLLDNAMVRVPALESAQVKQFYQRPRVVHGRQQLHRRPRARHGQPVRRLRLQFDGHRLGRWCRQGTRGMDHRRRAGVDLWPVDIRRFARFNGTSTGCRTASRKCSACTTRCRGRIANSSRPARSAVRRYFSTARRRCLLWIQDGVGARQFFRAVACPGDDRVRLGPPELALLGRRRASRLSRGVAVFDMSSFAKLQLAGPDAWPALQWLLPTTCRELRA